MARIKIKDLPKDRRISKEKMKKVMGGMVVYNKPGSFDVTQGGGALPSAGLWVGMVKG
jgi:hypothetical protein